MATHSSEAGTFDAAAVEALRLILKPKRERYDLVFTMNRWAVIAGIRSRDEASQNVEPVIENLDELVAGLVGDPPGTLYPDEDQTPARQRRERVDSERWAASLLAVIFNEYAKAAPSRVTRSNHTDTSERDKSSPFYQFAAAAFEAVGRKPSVAGHLARRFWRTPSTWSRYGMPGKSPHADTARPWR
jgi:hypothetical protein